MNPLLWRGPEFLLFYAVLAAALLIWQFVRGRKRDEDASNQATRKANLNDPYEIAYLRGGKNELLRVATVYLIERKILATDPEGDKGIVHLASPEEAGKLTDPVEQFVADYFSARAEASDILKATPNSKLQSALAQYQWNLQCSGLFRTVESRDGRARDCGIVLATLLSLAGVKLAIALSAGRHNVGFLILFAIAATVLSAIVAFSGNTTPSGIAATQDMQSLCGGLRHRYSRMTPEETALLFGVYGLNALPESGVLYGDRLYPKAAKNKGDGSSGCGSVDGGGGGGCGSGGGGCGGGGCGGCGS